MREHTRPHSRLALSLLVSLTLAAPGFGQGLRILVTNDDGIGATALEETVKSLVGLGEIVVAAPAEDTSYQGFAKTTPSGLLRLRPARIDGAVKAFAVRGTSIDAVTWAIETQGPFDAVIAGVNRGSTLGDDAMSSGIVGAALFAARQGLVAVAVAQDKTAHVYDVAAHLAADIVRRALASDLPTGVAFSINVPASATRKPQGVVIAPLGDAEYATLGFQKVERDSPEEMWRVQFKKNRRPDPGTDLDWYDRGEITVTPLSWANTATAFLDLVASWQLQAPTPAIAP